MELALWVYMLGTDMTAKTITKALSPDITNAHANLLAVLTGLPFLALHAKKRITSGVSTTMKNGLID